MDPEPGLCEEEHGDGPASVRNGGAFGTAGDRHTVRCLHSGLCRELQGVRDLRLKTLSFG